MTPTEPEPRREQLAAGVGLGLSLLVHAGILAAIYFAAGGSPPIVQKRGEPLFVDLAQLDEPAPRGNPAEPPPKAPSRPSPKGPAARGKAATPAPKAAARASKPTAPPAAIAQVVPPAPTGGVRVPSAAPPAIKEMPAPESRVASLPRTDSATPAPPVPEVKERAVPVPRAEPRAARPDLPAPPAPAERPAELPRATPRLAQPDTPAATERAVPAPSPASSQGRPEAAVAKTEVPVPVPSATKETPNLDSPPRVASALRPGWPTPSLAPGGPSAPGPAGPAQGPGGVPEPGAGATGDRLAALRPGTRGGGLREGRGGIEGEPVPLDTRDPRFGDYFERLRRAIKEKWSYPREAAEKNIGGSLVMEFGIAKSGHLRFIEVRRSSGVAVLDAYAVNAVKLASPFPPIPDEMSRTGIPVVAVFNYIIDIGSLTNFLR